MPLILGKVEEDDEIWSKMFIGMLLTGTIPPPCSVGTADQFGKYETAGDWEHTMTAAKTGDQFGEWLAGQVLEEVESKIIDGKQSSRYLTTILAWAERALEMPDTVPDYFWEGLMTPQTCGRFDDSRDFTLNTQRIRMIAAIAPCAKVYATFKRYAPDEWRYYGIPVPDILHPQDQVSEDGFRALQDEVVVRSAQDLMCRAAVSPFVIGKSVNRDRSLSKLAVEMLMTGLTPPAPISFHRDYRATMEREKGSLQLRKWISRVVLEVEAALKLRPIKSEGEAYLQALGRWAWEASEQHEAQRDFAFWHGLLTSSPGDQEICARRISTVRKLIPFDLIRQNMCNRLPGMGFGEPLQDFEQRHGIQRPDDLSDIDD